MLAGIYGGKPGPCKPRRPWRESFAEVRTALREAERLTGKERTHALVRVCRAFMRADGDDAPGWVINKKGEGVRAETAETRAFDRADKALDRKINGVVGRCLCCFATEHGVPEDPLIYLIQDEEAGRLRGRRTKLAAVAKDTGILFERSEGWWVVSLRGVPGAATQGPTLRSAFRNLRSLLVDFEQMHRDGELRLSARRRAVIARTLAMEIPPSRRRPRATKRAR